MEKKIMYDFVECSGHCQCPGRPVSRDVGDLGCRSSFFGRTMATGDGAENSPRLLHAMSTYPY